MLFYIRNFGFGCNLAGKEEERVQTRMSRKSHAPCNVLATNSRQFTDRAIQTSPFSIKYPFKESFEGTTNKL